MVGTTLQIVTETLFALLHQNTPVKVDEIHLLSTSTGIHSIQDNLLIPGKGILYQFFDDYQIPAHTVIINPLTIKHFDGHDLADIRTTDENEAAREFIVRHVANQAKRENIRIFASIAGGRKTMSAYLSLAMNLYGRKNDRLSHVLVNPSEHELDKSFFYPKPGDEKIKLRSGEEIYARDVKIDMADIPFIQLHPLLKNYYRHNFRNIENLFKISQKTIDELGKDIEIRFSPKQLILEIVSGENSPVRSKPIPPKEASIYRLAFKSEAPLPIHHQKDELEKIYLQIKNREFDKKPDWNQENIQKKISNLNRILSEQFPSYLFHQIKLDTVKIKVLTHYFIPVPRKDRKLSDN